MKKLLVFGLACLYLVLSFGFTRYEHVCKSEKLRTYAQVPLEQHADKPCPICQQKEKSLTEKKKGCCQYEPKLVKLDEGLKKQVSVDFSVKFWGASIPNETLGAVFDALMLPGINRPSFYLSTKLPVGSNPLYILNCVYRI